MSMEPTENRVRLTGLSARARRWAVGWALAWRLADADVPHGLARKAVVLDLAERAFVSVIFFRFMYNLFFGFSSGNATIIALIAFGETLPFVYILLRIPSTSLSQRPTDWIFAMLGTVMPLFVLPNTNGPIILPTAIVAMMLAGILLQIMAKLIIGRAFGIVAANRGVRVMGPYRFVRHPMYAGYMLTHIGFLLANPSYLNALVYGTGLTIQIVRIFREERVLKKDADYRVFAARVRYRLLPGIF